MSSAIYIDKSAGNGSTIVSSSIGVGGSRSGAVADFQGGKNHTFEQNIIKHMRGVKPLRTANGVDVSDSDNTIEMVQ